jgi:hypothetical protein
MRTNIISKLTRSAILVFSQENSRFSCSTVANSSILFRQVYKTITSSCLNSDLLLYSYSNNVNSLIRVTTCNFPAGRNYVTELSLAVQTSQNVSNLAYILVIVCSLSHVFTSSFPFSSVFDCMSRPCVNGYRLNACGLQSCLAVHDCPNFIRFMKTRVSTTTIDAHVDCIYADDHAN